LPPARLPAGVEVAANYTLALIASPSCAVVTDWYSHQPLPFPESARARSYDVVFDGSSVVMGRGVFNKLGAASDYPGEYPQDPNDLMIIVPPSAAALERCDTSPAYGPILANLAPTCAGGDYWWEKLSSNEVFEICGTLHATVDNPARIAGTIEGAFVYYQGTALKWNADLYCRAKDHQFTLTAR
jgi:hypothetical protein